MEYIVACPDPELLEALCAFAEHLGTRLVALAGGANGMAAVAAFTHDHRAWFRLWRPLGETTPSRDTYLRRVRRLDPETAVKAALWLRDGTRRPGLRVLILALDGQVARRSGDRAAGTRPLHLVSAFLVREGLTPIGSRARPRATRLRPSPVGSSEWPWREPWSRSTPPAARRPSCRPCARPVPTMCRPRRNQGTRHREVKAAFNDAERGAFAPEVQDHCETVERNGGRRARGAPVPCWAVPASASGWRTPRPGPGLRSLIRVQAERTGPRGRRQRAVRYYIPAARWTRRPCWTSSAATGGSRTACTAPWTCSSARTTAACARGMPRAVMGILRRAALNMLRTLQQNFSKDVSIGLLRDRIGRQPWMLAAALP